jgi:hypothetical protein
MKHGLALVAVLGTVAVFLGGCVQTRDLYTVRQLSRPAAYASDDRPRVNFFDRDVKRSFRDFVDSECSAVKLDRATREMATPKDKTTWSSVNRRSTICVARVAGYATEQCEYITLHQNEVAAGANLALGAIAIGGALAATSYALEGVKTGKDAVAVAGGTVAATNAGRSFLPANATVNVSGMLTTAPSYAEAIGLTDNDDFYAGVSEVKDTLADKVDPWQLADDGAMDDARTGQTQEERNVWPARATTERGLMLLARIHDAAFSQCAANAYGLQPSSRPSG